MHLFLTLSVATAVAATTNGTAGNCKNSYKSASWPSSSVWSQLNDTIGGNLLKPLPPAVVCDQHRPLYNASQCQLVNDTWFSVLSYDADPLSLHAPNWQNDACLPPAVYDGPHTCNLHPYAKYVVNASEPQHVVEAIKFASENNIRVSVKNTGHDYLGRSTSPGFQIWTHYLKNLTYHNEFHRSNCSSTEVVPAITMGAGNQYAEVYTFANKHNVIVVGGADPGVGVGGHFTGGGHSPMGSLYGLAVDNALEMTIVTPSGELVTANQCQNADLFWAFRGGGGSTFGVLISLTTKAHPNVPAASITVYFHSTKSEAKNYNNTHFYSLLADMQPAIIEWSDNYINGYSTIAPTSSTSASYADLSNTVDTTRPQPLTAGFGGWGLNQTAAQVNATLKSFVEKIHSTPGINYTVEVVDLPKASSILGTNITGIAGYNALMGSRLWDKPAMLDRQGLLNVFYTVRGGTFQQLIISGPAVRNDSLIAETSVSPAWRKTYSHNIAATAWVGRNKTIAADRRTQQTALTKTLQDHAPDMGAYLNEADVEQPDPDQTFWGSNYARLLQIKRQYDPEGMFWCKPCVGMEDWILNEKTGELCRA